MNNLKRIETFVIVVLIALAGIIFAFKKPVIAPATETSLNQNQTSDQTPSGDLGLNPDSSDAPTPPPTQQVPTSVISYKGVDGKNALDLLKANHRVDAKTYSYGSFVTTIDGIQPDASHFWAFYVNDQFSQVAADKYVTKSTDDLRWQIDAVVNTK